MGLAFISPSSLVTFFYFFGMKRHWDVHTFFFVFFNWDVHTCMYIHMTSPRPLTMTHLARIRAHDLLIIGSMPYSTAPQQLHSPTIRTKYLI